jgi:hypothetical protein
MTGKPQVQRDTLSLSLLFGRQCHMRIISRLVLL